MSQSPRGLRYVVIAVLCLVLIIVISTTSNITQNTYNSAAEILKDSQSKWTSQSRVSGDSQSGLKSEESLIDTKDTSKGGGKQGSLKPLEYGSTSQTSPNPLAGEVQFRGKPSDLPRVNATFVTLARNSDVWEIARSIRQVEDRFNWQFGYDWVFLNDKPFDDEFKAVTSALVSGKVHYGLIPTEHWSYPSWIDQNKAAQVRADMARKKIIYGDSESYRHMCRYESGFFFRHPLMMNYQWYWRVEPSIELFCDIKYDAFRFMEEHGKKYSFVLSLFEYIDTIPTLWDSTKKWMNKHPEHISENNAMAFVSDDQGSTYNKCHFWSNFEIGSLEWLRSDAYLDYFNSLDQDGGFFYERWGDAPVHSIAAALTLRKDEIHFFDDIAYYHIPFTHCPTEEKVRLEKKCHCNPKDNFDWNGYSCTKKFFEISQIALPPGQKDTKKRR